MPYYQNVVTRDGIAAGAILPARILTWTASGGDNVDAASAGTDYPIGVSPEGAHDTETANAADAGDQFEFFVGGTVKIEAGAAISIGDLVSSGAAGVAATAAPSDKAIGVALTAAADAGDLIAVQIDRMTA